MSRSPIFSSRLSAPKSEINLSISGRRGSERNPTDSTGWARLDADGLLTGRARALRELELEAGYEAVLRQAVGC